MHAMGVRLSLGAAAVLSAGVLTPLVTSSSAVTGPSCTPSGSNTVCTFSDVISSAWQVPAGVTQATIDAYGGQGGLGHGASAGTAGLGGETLTTIGVTPGEYLQVAVGERGSAGTATTGGNGGYGGRNDARGGTGGVGSGPGGGGGGGGGGASDIRTGACAVTVECNVADRLIVAGGGGGGAPYAGTNSDGTGVGGDGGGSTGEAGGDGSQGNGGSGGGGGAQAATTNGGAGGPDDGDPGTDGTAGNGGTGGNGSVGVVAESYYGGGGGGGGTYGGGGGGGSEDDYSGGGGGGSNLGPGGSGFTQGVRSGDGLVTITYTTPVAGTDTTPPTVTCSASPDTLTPPNHSMVPITATVNVSDAGSGPAGFVLKSVGSNQKPRGLGAGDVPDDKAGWTKGTPDTSGQLRAERFTKTRVYQLAYVGKDVAGNKTKCLARVTVPK
jgi:hypothetical protein